MEVPASLRERLEAHALEGYPAEVCGILLGHDGDVRRVTVARAARNLRGTTTRDRYEIDPRDTLAADREAREAGLALLGFYHSHPDHPAAPSATDARRAWPWYTYLILSTDGRALGDARAWRLEGEEMVEEPLRFIPEAKVGGSAHEQA